MFLCTPSALHALITPPRGHELLRRRANYSAALLSKHALCPYFAVGELPPRDFVRLLPPFRRAFFPNREFAFLGGGCRASDRGLHPKKTSCTCVYGGRIVSIFFSSTVIFRRGKMFGNSALVEVGIEMAWYQARGYARTLANHLERELGEYAVWGGQDVPPRA